MEGSGIVADNAVEGNKISELKRIFNFDRRY